MTLAYTGNHTRAPFMLATGGSVTECYRREVVRHAPPCAQARHHHPRHLWCFARDDHPVGLLHVAQRLRRRGRGHVLMHLLHAPLVGVGIVPALRVRVLLRRGRGCGLGLGYHLDVVLVAANLAATLGTATQVHNETHGQAVGHMGRHAHATPPPPGSME